MSLKQKERLSNAILFAGLVAGVIGAYSNLFVTLAGLALLSAGLLLQLHWRRCPHCGDFLGRGGIPDFCPHCGKAVGPDGKKP